MQVEIVVNADAGAIAGAVDDDVDQLALQALAPDRSADLDIRHLS